MNTLKYLRDSVLEIILVALAIALGIAAPGFFTPDNILNVLRNVSMQGLIAFGMTMVIIAGEIDLSVGSAVAFAGCLTALVTKELIAAGMAAELAIPVAMVVALTAGFLSGTLTGFYLTILCTRSSLD